MADRRIIEFLDAHLTELDLITEILDELGAHGAQDENAGC